MLDGKTQWVAAYLAVTALMMACGSGDAPAPVAGPPAPAPAPSPPPPPPPPASGPQPVNGTFVYYRSTNRVDDDFSETFVDRQFVDGQSSEFELEWDPDVGVDVPHSEGSCNAYVDLWLPEIQCTAYAGGQIFAIWSSNTNSLDSAIFVRKDSMTVSRVDLTELRALASTGLAFDSLIHPGYPGGSFTIRSDGTAIDVDTYSGLTMTLDAITVDLLFGPTGAVVTGFRGDDSESQMGLHAYKAVSSGGTSSYFLIKFGKSLVTNSDPRGFSPNLDWQL